MVDTQTRPLTRDKLARLAGGVQELIRYFENLQDDVGTALPQAVDAAAAAAAAAEATAAAAVISAAAAQVTADAAASDAATAQVAADAAQATADAALAREVDRFETTSAVPAVSGAAAMWTTPHGRTRAPDSYSFFLRCVNPEVNYVAGDEVALVSEPGVCKYSSSANATDLTFRMLVTVSGPPAIANGDGSNTYNTVTPGDWLLVVRAIWVLDPA